MLSDGNGLVKELGNEVIKNKKFNGKRLKDARIYRDITMVDLASNIGVSKQAISQFEKGLSFPQFKTLMSITDYLDFPREYFLEEDNLDIIGGNVYFRAKSKMSSKERDKQILKTRYIGQIYNFLSEYIEFPKLNIPSLDDCETIEDKALKLREYWGLGLEPITDVIYELEKNGIIVAESNVDTDLVDGYSQEQVINGEKHFLIVLGNDNGSATRRQFSAAHELAHILLHDSFIEFDEDDEKKKHELKNKMEKEAHEFAAAFLLPKDSFISEVSVYPTDLEYYKQLKKKWRTSISAMLVRANHIGVLSYSSYQNTIKKMSKLGWRKNEPLDDTLIINRPTLLKRAIGILLDNDIFDEDDIMAELSKRHLSLPRSEVEGLLGLKPGTLKSKKKELELKVLKMPKR